MISSRHAQSSPAPPVSWAWGCSCFRGGTKLDAIGVAAALGAAAVMAAGIVLSKRWPSPRRCGDHGLAARSREAWSRRRSRSPSRGRPATLTAGNLAGYAYLAIVGAALAYALWFRGIRALSPANVTFLALLSPVVAAALGWIALGQHLTPPRRSAS